MSVDTKGVLVYKENQISNPIFFIPSVLERIKKAIEKEMNQNIPADLRGFQRRAMMTFAHFRVANEGEAFFQAEFEEKEAGETKYTRQMHIFFDVDSDHKDRLESGERAIVVDMGDFGCSRRVIEAVLRAFPEFGQWFQPCDAADEYKKIN